MEQNFLYSSARANILEHVFIGEVMRCLWRRECYESSVLKSDVDSYGYDVVIECGEVIRHIQLKSAVTGGRRTSVPVNLSLCLKPSGCVVLLFCNDDLSIAQIRFLGGKPGEKLMDLSGHKAAKRPTPNKSGVKPERKNTKEVKISSFEKLKGFGDLTDRLFG